MEQRILNFGLSRFPNASESSQSSKVRGEIKEYYAEKPYSDEWYFELADVYIASKHAWLRFRNPVYRMLAEQIEARSDFHIVYEYIERKMEINETREWDGDQHKYKIIKRINYKTGKITEEVIDAKKI